MTLGGQVFRFFLFQSEKTKNSEKNSSAIFLELGPSSFRSLEFSKKVTFIFSDGGRNFGMHGFFSRIVVDCSFRGSESYFDVELKLSDDKFKESSSTRESVFHFVFSSVFAFARTLKYDTISN